MERYSAELHKEKASERWSATVRWSATAFLEQECLRQPDVTQSMALRILDARGISHARNLHQQF